MTTLSEDSASARGGGADPVERVASALRSHNIEAIVVDTGAEARDVVLGLIPEGSEAADLLKAEHKPPDQLDRARRPRLWRKLASS